jgi:hypothetical protein
MLPERSFVPSPRSSLVLGALATALLFYLSAKLIVVNQSYAIYAGIVGGTLAAGLRNGQWANGLEAGFKAGVLALPLMLVLFVLHDLILTAKYDIVLIREMAPPQDLLSKILLYTIHEAILAFYVIGLFPLGGLVGGVLGWLLNQGASGMKSAYENRNARR